MTTIDSITDTLHEPTGAKPSDYSRALPGLPVLSSAGRDWQYVSLERFQVEYLDVRFDASCVHKVTLHLAGPILIERTRDGSRDRKWSDTGHCSLIPAGVPTTRWFKGRADFMIAYVAPTVVDEVAADAFNIDPARGRLVESMAVTDEALERFGHLLLAEAEAGGGGTRLFADTVSRALAMHLLRTYSAHSPPAVIPAAAMVGWRLRRAIDYMHANLTDNIPLARLSSVAGLSPSHFARTFRAATDEPPHRYLTRLRIEQARHLLEHTRLPIIDIGLRCGFEQNTHFATMFRKTMGMSPRAYRAERCT